MPQVKIAVSPVGEVKIEGVGFTGPACEAATLALKAALENPTSVKKPEFYQAAGVDQSA